MTKKWKAFAASILVPLATGALSGFLTREGMKSFNILLQPALSPPAWVFPVAWTILYVLMGISSYLIYTSAEEMPGTEGKKEDRKKKITRAFTIYGYQLIVNFLWPVFFFSFKWYFFSFLWLIFLWVLVAKMILEFGELSKTAALLNVPYLLWLSFAGYLNLGIWLLN